VLNFGLELDPEEPIFLNLLFSLASTFALLLLRLAFPATVSKLFCRFVSDTAYLTSFAEQILFD
jgi:hypothetical protein